MRIVAFLSSVGLAFLAGLALWSAAPTGRPFSWAERAHEILLVGRAAGTSRSHEEPPTMSDFEAARTALLDSVDHDHLAYGIVRRYGRHADVGSWSDPLPRGEAYVSSGFFAARDAGIHAGRMFGAGSFDEAVIGNGLARRLFGRPTSALGQRVRLRMDRSSHVVTSMLIVGVLEPSAGRDPDLDLDDALIMDLAGATADEPHFIGSHPLVLHVRLFTGTGASEARDSIRRWASAYFGPMASVVDANERGARRPEYVTSARHRVQARRATLSIVAGLTFVAVSLAVWAFAVGATRRHHELGLDLVYGGGRRRRIAHAVWRDLRWASAGAPLGCALLFVLDGRLPEVFVEKPSLPLVAQALVASLGVVGVSIACGISQIAGHSPATLVASRLRPPMRLMLPATWIAFGLALTVCVASSQTYLHARQQAMELADRFGGLYAMQSGQVFWDARSKRTFTASGVKPLFDADAGVVMQESVGALQTAVAEFFQYLEVAAGAVEATVPAMIADGGYVPLMGYAFAEGDGEACVVTTGLATALHLEIGRHVDLGHRGGHGSCRISGILEPYPEAWSWLLPETPDIVVPPADGLSLPFLDASEGPFRSTRVLVRLADTSSEERVLEWLESEAAGEYVELVPYALDAPEMLVSIGTQATMYLLLAFFAAGCSALATATGFLTVIDRRRQRYGLDRVYGRSAASIARSWWFAAVGGAVGTTAVASVSGSTMATWLYDALALDVASLPPGTDVPMNALLVAAILVITMSLATGLTIVAGRRSITLPIGDALAECPAVDLA